jgi:hypothetical protein
MSNYAIITFDLKAADSQIYEKIKLKLEEMDIKKTITK